MGLEQRFISLKGVRLWLFSIAFFIIQVGV
jgi:hypothetical protein